MTRVSLDSMYKDGAHMVVSSDANFVSTRFPEYKLGADNSIIEVVHEPAAPSLKEIVARETIQLLEQRKRLSVRELAKKFDKGLTAVAKLSEEAKWKEVASLDRHVLLKKLRDLLESLKGRVAGRNKDDIEEAISMVEALAVQLTQREGKLIQEKSEVTRLAIFLKQATEDAKKVVEEERALARAEIENARESIHRVEKALLEQEKSKGSNIQSLDELMNEVQEARRIKMLHQPSRVMDMEHELQALRIQLYEKSLYAIQLRKELEIRKKSEESAEQHYQLEGAESLGSCLHVKCRKDASSDNSISSVQWFRVMPDGSKKELISGATKPVYAPEPFDVGRILQAEIVVKEEKATVTTSGPIDPAPGLGNYVEALMKKSDVEFNVVVIQSNGKDEQSSSVHVFHVGKLRIKLCKGRATKAKEMYSSSMQLCGVRGGGSAAAQALFWQVRRGLSYTLAFESERERNAAIMLARRLAFDCNIMLAGPDDRAGIKST